MNKPQPKVRENRAPRPTIKELLAQGPTFQPEVGPCKTCVGANEVDASTGLCRSCWRVWRWSPIREREIPEGM